MTTAHTESHSLKGNDCLECGGVYRTKRVVECFTIRGDTVCIEGIPAFVCDVCGDRQFSADVTSQIQRILREQRPPDRHVPAYDFSAGERAASSPNA